jgi:hypothetical protein
MTTILVSAKVVASESGSRPWAVAYISHVRSLAGSWDEVERNRAIWCGFLVGLLLPLLHIFHISSSDGGCSRGYWTTKTCPYVLFLLMFVFRDRSS